MATIYRGLGGAPGPRGPRGLRGFTGPEGKGYLDVVSSESTTPASSGSITLTFNKQGAFTVGQRVRVINTPTNYFEGTITAITGTISTDFDITIQRDYALGSTLAAGWTMVVAGVPGDGEGGTSGFSGDYNDLTNKPTIPSDVSDLTDTENLLGGGGSIAVGDGNGPSVENVTEILINGTITEIEPGLVGVSVGLPSITIPATPVVLYKGLQASYGVIHSNDESDELNVNKIVIHKPATTTLYIDPTGSQDEFDVNGLGTSDILAMFIIYGDVNGAKPLADLQNFTQAVIDNVILVNGEAGVFRSVDGMKNAFYESYTTLASAANGLYTNFEFYVSSSPTLNDGPTTVRQGSGASFVLSDASPAPGYTLMSIPTGGTNYLPGHKIKILGTDLGGTTPENDAIITVTAAPEGVITGAFAEGTAFATAPVLGWTVTGTNYNVGSGLAVISVANTGDSVSLSNTGSNYVVGDVITLLGENIAGGTTPFNNVTITVTEVGLIGEVFNFTVSAIVPVTIWPTNSISDGGEDQYDNANYINTNLAAEINYNGGETVVDGTAVFGAGSTYSFVYDTAIFGLFVTGNSATGISTSGNSGADGDSITETGYMFGGGEAEETFDNAVTHINIVGGEGVDGIRFSDDTIQTSAYQGTGNIEFRNDTINDINGVAITNASQLTADTARISIPANGSGDILITNNNTSWAFNSNGGLRLPGGSNGLIGESEPGVVVFSDLGFAVVTNANTEGSKSWIFDLNGALVFPNNALVDSADSNIEFRGMNNFNVEAGGVVNIVTDSQGAGHSWQFGDDGILSFTNDLTIGPDSLGTIINQNNSKKLDIRTNGPTASGYIGWWDGFELANISFNPGGAKNVTITTGDVSYGNIQHEWEFRLDGGTYFPGAIAKGPTYATGLIRTGIPYSVGAGADNGYVGIGPGWDPITALIPDYVADLVGFTITAQQSGSTIFTTTITQMRTDLGGQPAFQTADPLPAYSPDITFSFASPDYAPQTQDPLVLATGNKNWAFDTDGSLTFPDTTVQTTAYPGITNVAGVSETLVVGGSNMTKDALSVRVVAGMGSNLDVEINYSLPSASATVMGSSTTVAFTQVLTQPLNIFSGQQTLTANNTTWTIINAETLGTIGDSVTAVISDKSFHKIYRVTVMARTLPDTGVPGDAYCTIEVLK